MRKVFALTAALVVGLVLAVSPAPAGRIDGDSGGPTCADIVNGAVVDYSAGTLSFALQTAAPSCKGLTYTVEVYSDADPTHPFIASGSASGTKQVDVTGTPFLIVTISGLPAADSYCISAKSSDSRVFDVAPDTGCISFPVSSSGGQSGFN